MSSAIVGVGLAGTNHLAALTSSGVPVAGLLSRQRARTESAAARWRVPAYRDVEELLSDPDVDVVHVCVPTAWHRVFVEAALDAGKAVLCEKPLAIDADEAAALAGRAGDAGTHTRVAFNRRFDRGVQLLREVIAGGELGQPINVWGSYEQAFNAAPTSVDWRFDPEAIGSTRVVSELGSHWFDLAAHVLDARLVQVSPLLSDPRGKRDVDVDGTGGPQTVTPPNEDAFAALLEYSNGVSGTVYATELAHGAWDDITLRIDGSKRSAKWVSGAPNQLVVAHKREGIRVLGDSSPGASLDAMVAEFYGLSDSAIAATFEDGWHSCATIDAIGAGGRDRRGWSAVGREPLQLPDRRGA